MQSLVEAFTSLFQVNMGVTPGERLLIFCDAIRQDETPSQSDEDRRTRLLQTAQDAALYADNRFGNTLFVTFPATAASGVEPPENVWRAAFGDSIIDRLATEGILPLLLAKTASPVDVAKAEAIVHADKQFVANVIVALANNSTSHTRFRALTTSAGTRFASLPHFDPEMFFTSMRVNWHALADRTAILSDEINKAEEITVETPNGTHMRFGKKGRVAKGDDGLLTAPGSFGNLPAGEVYLAPLEGTTNGVMVIEYAPTRKLSTPLRLIVNEGNVTAIEGDEPYRDTLELKFAEGKKNRNIAELGIGTNDRATRPDNILEAEKILGTIHIALGDNSGFGGTVQTPFHEDYVFYRPTLTAIHADGSRKTLLQNGMLLL